MQPKERSFVFYESWYNILTSEPSEVQWEVFRAVMEYVFRGSLVELKPRAGMAFKFIRQDIDRAKERYDAIAEKRRAAGAKGGQRTAAAKQAETETDGGDNRHCSPDPQPTDPQPDDSQANEANASKCKQKQQNGFAASDPPASGQKGETVSVENQQVSSKRSKCKHNDNDNDIAIELNSPPPPPRAHESESRKAETKTADRHPSRLYDVPIDVLRREVCDELERYRSLAADKPGTQLLNRLRASGLTQFEEQREALWAFCNHLEQQGIAAKRRSDFRVHFCNWAALRREIESRELEALSRHSANNSISTTNKNTRNNATTTKPTAADRLHNTGNYANAEPSADF